MEDSAAVTSISAWVFVGTAPVLAALDQDVSPKNGIKNYKCPVCIDAHPQSNCAVVGKEM